MSPPVYAGMLLVPGPGVSGGYFLPSTRTFATIDRHEHVDGAEILPHFVRPADFWLVAGPTLGGGRVVLVR